MRSISVPDDEWWWGGAVADGQHMPFGRSAHRRNLGDVEGRLGRRSTAGANQSAPLLVSSRAGTCGPSVPSSSPSTAGETSGGRR